VHFTSSNHYAASELNDTIKFGDSVRCAEGWCDTIWGKTFQLNQSGTTTITAYTDCDAEHQAVFTTRQLRVFKDTQNIVFDAPATLDVGQTATLHGRASSGLRVWYNITGGDSAVTALRSDSILAALKVGTANITAIQPGNNVYEAAQVERTVQILAPNEGVLFDLRFSSGELTEPFAPNRLEYEYNLPCVDDTMIVHYDLRSTLETEAEQINDTTFVVEPFRTYGSNGKELKIKITTHQNKVNEYTFALRARLPKEYIYYAPETFANRMEVVNNPIALSGRQFSSYRWFENDSMLSETSGVLYRKDGFKIGSIYSVLAFYDERYVYNRDSTYICGQRAVVASNNLMVYPNPAGTYIVIQHPQVGISNDPILLFNSMGAEVGSFPPQSITIDAADHAATLDISNLQAGAYVVRFMSASVVFVKQ
jgi:hypothetical protein